MKRYLSHFQYHWIKYILIIVVPIVFWTSIFDILADKLLSSVTYYTESFYEEERSYGMVLFESQQNNVFSEYYNGTETCYVFFSSHSVNLGQLNTTGNTVDDVALKVLDYLLSEDL